MLPIRVLHIINSLGLGGAERVLCNLLQAHDQSVVQPSVITLTNLLDFAAPLRARGIPVASLNLSGLWRIPLAIGKLRSIISILKPDIVHTNLTASNLSGRVAASMQGQQHILSGIHSHMEDHLRNLSFTSGNYWKMRVIGTLDIWTDRYAQPIHIACSRYVAEYGANTLKLPAKRLQVIYNGMAVPPLTPFVPFSEQADRPIELLTVGRLVEQKGHTYLLQAMPSIIAKYPYVRLSIVGHGPLGDQLQTQIRGLGIEAYVNMLGNRKDIFDLLQRSDVFVFPSTSEGLPLAPLEALAYGIPLVGSDIPPIREIIDPDVHGILVPAQNHEQLAQAIVRMLDTPGLAQTLRANGHKRIMEQFNIDIMARTIETLYTELMMTV